MQEINESYFLQVLCRIISEVLEQAKNRNKVMKF